MNARLALAFGLAVTALATPVHGADVSGRRWRTLTTEWCNVHFHVEVEQSARRVSALCDEGIYTVNAMLQTAPMQRVEVVVTDFDDRANGLAQSVPYNRVRILAINPDNRSALSHTADALHLVLLHELFHIAHLDTVSGVPQWVNRVLGKAWPPNVLQPRFMVEGMATYAESRALDGGRLRAELYRAPLRLAALENDLWSLDDVANFSRRSPGGSAAYLYGVNFIGWLVGEHGETVLAELAHAMSNDFVPYRVAASMRDVTGRDMQALWDAFLSDVRTDAERFKAQVERRGGATRSRRLTRIGGTMGPLTFDTNGDGYFMASPPNGLSGIYRLRGLPHDVPHPEAIVRTSAVSTVAPMPGGTLVFGQLERAQGQLDFYDLFTLRAHESVHRLTDAFRVRDPAPHPDGRHVVAEHRSATETGVALVDVRTGAHTLVAAYNDGSQVFSPTVSPDGRFAVYALHRIGGNRKIWEVNLKTKARRPITQVMGDDFDPSYSPDGRYIVFSSDRHGALDAYAYERATHDVLRLTRTLGAVLAPRVTPDGRGLVYLGSHIYGTDLFATAFAPEPHHDNVVSAAPPMPPATVIKSVRYDEREAEVYNPLTSSLPRRIIPIVGPGLNGGNRIGVSVSGEDAVDLHRYGVEAAYESGLNTPDVSVAYRWNNSYFPISASARTRAVQSFIAQDRDEDAIRREAEASAGLEATLPLRRWLRSHNLSVGYRRTVRVWGNLGGRDPQFDPGAPNPQFPSSSNLGWVTLRYTYSDIDQDRDTVGAASGQALSIEHRASNQLTQSALDLYETSFDARMYRPVPGLPRHTLALFVYGGFAVGDRTRRTNYFLGGFADRDFTYDLVNQIRFGGRYLRGYASSSDVGDGFLLGSVEYRLPVWEIEQGFEALPLHFSRLSAVAFGDMGEAFDGVPRVNGVRASVGGELQLSLLLGYYGSFLVRAGIARGLMAGGEEQPYVVLGLPY